MKDLYRLNKLIRELNQDLKMNTMMLNAANRSERFSDMQKLMVVRQELFKSIAHYQAQVIRIYEDAYMSNVVSINRKAA